MRQLLLFLLLLGQTAFAQKMGASGAEWYRNREYGVYRCFADGDTTIEGKLCANIRHETLVFPGSPPWVRNSIGSLFIHDAGDTVFIYNDIFKKMTPLYVFNVVLGDTVCLPITMPIADDAMSPDWEDSSFCFVIDSVKDVLYDTSTRQTVFSHPIGDIKKNPRYSWGSRGYARQIGGVAIGLLPRCENCWSILVEGGSIATEIRCYGDSTTSIKLITSDCNGGTVPLSLHQPESQSRLEIYPNPVTDFIKFHNGTGKKVRDVRVTDITGKTMDAPNLSVSQFSPGLYMVHFNLDGIVVTKKITVAPN